MRKLLVIAVTALVFGIGAVLPQDAVADKVTSLRGNNDLMSESSPPMFQRLKLDEPELPRAYKQQPPLIPHKTERYQIDLKSNECLKCHDKDNYKEEEAPMAGKSHYINAEGKEQDKIVMGRYFCSQCHVPQVDSDPLVENTFQGSN